MNKNYYIKFKNDFSKYNWIRQVNSLDEIKRIFGCEDLSEKSDIIRHIEGKEWAEKNWKDKEKKKFRVEFLKGKEVDELENY